MKLTTSDLGSVKADIRFNITNPEPFKYNRCFLGIHIDFSTHQILLYLGIMTLFIEIFPPFRTWGGTVDRTRTIFKFWKIWVLKHDTNHIPHDYFFNVGITYSERKIILFLWKWRLIINE